MTAPDAIRLDQADNVATAVRALEAGEQVLGDMDIDAGRVLSGEASVEQLGTEIFEAWLRIASGKPPLSERQGLGDNEFVPWQIGATM